MKITVEQNYSDLVSVTLNRKEQNIKVRVRSWLRMNAGGVPNTCKSNGV